MRLIPERRILVYVGVMMAGVAFATIHHDMLASIPIAIAVGCGFVIAAVMGLRPVGRLIRWQPMMVALGWCLAGVLSAMLHIAQLPSGLGDRAGRIDVVGTIEHVDGRFDRRLRMWLRVGDIIDGPADIAPYLEGRIVRLSVRPVEMIPRAGDMVRVVARIYPPPGRVLHGAPDYSLRARARDVVASGYVVGIRDRPREGGFGQSLAAGLSSYRQARADRIASSMTAPAGGIAAALLIGDRRYISEATYDLFRGSGLAHLLAISGLHMGLLCFGLIACLRGVAALMPSVACRWPVHKFAAIAGVMAGFGYVLLSGLSISAIRAFLMALLILAAWLMDRLGLTVRNVGLAAGAILVFSPLALFSAGFQLSFAATAALVIWFEGWRHRQSGTASGGRFIRWGLDLVTASMIASIATLPLTAYHFGVVTPWGVMANLLGIPLTGLWIMPAGLAVLITDMLPLPEFISILPVLVMQGGINALVMVAGWFSSLPVSPLPVTPPPPALLIVGYAGFGLLTCLRGQGVKRAVCGGCLAIVIAVCLVVRPPMDGVLFARGKNVHIVMPGGEGVLTGFTSPGGRRLSDFLADNAMRSLAGKTVTTGGAGAIAMFDHRGKGDIAIVTARRALSAGCRSGAKLVIATVQADYPCRDGTPLISLAGLPPENYLLRFAEEGVQARASDGQYFLIRPVSRP